MKKLLAVALGILTAIGGFVDIGDLVTNAAVGSRFGLSLVWVVVVGVVGHLRVRGDVRPGGGGQRPADVRPRPGAPRAAGRARQPRGVVRRSRCSRSWPRSAAWRWRSSWPAIVNYLLWIPLAGFAVWLVIWRVKFAIDGERRSGCSAWP